MIDAASYFRALAAAVQRARQSILITGWDIDSRIQLQRGSRPDDRPPQLADFLNRVVSSTPGLHVHILCWDFAMLYALERQLFPVFRFDWQTHRRVKFRLDGNHPVGASHHQKIAVVDDAVAFVGGIDLTRSRWDTQEHRPDDPRRVDPTGRSYPPFHDVQLAVEGPAAAALGDLVRERWHRATGRRLQPPAPGAHDPWPPELGPDVEEVRVAIARTEPAYKDKGEVREVEKLYHDAIFAARRFIYIENQYLTSTAIQEWLGARLREQEGPEIVMVLPRRCSGWLEEASMGMLGAGLLGRLQAEDRYGRLRVYYPVVPGLGAAELNVHAKVMVVDDNLARVGSANLSNRSLGLDTECDLAIEAAGEARIEEAIAGFRNRLLAEHLGVAPGKVAAALDTRESLIAAIEHLRGAERTLEPLEVELPEEMDSLAPALGLADPERPLAPERFLEEFAPADQGKPGRTRLKYAITVLVLMFALSAAWRWTPLGDWLDLQKLSTWLGSLQGYPRAAFVVLGGYVVGSLLVVPVTLLILATAFTFGPVWGVAYSLAGSLLGAVLTYTLGRLLGRDIVRRLAGARVNRLSRRLGRHGLLAAASVRLLPLAPFTVINMVAGASHIRFRDFTFGTVLGMAPGILVMTLLENRLETAIRDPGPGAFAALAAIAALAVFAWIIIRRRLGDEKAPGRESPAKVDAGL